MTPHNGCGGIYTRHPVYWGDPTPFSLTASMAALERENERLKARLVEGERILRGMHDDNLDYSRRNHLGGENNHYMVQAREWLGLPAPIPGEPVSKSVAKRIAAQKGAVPVTHYHENCTTTGKRTVRCPHGVHHDNRCMKCD